MRRGDPHLFRGVPAAAVHALAVALGVAGCSLAGPPAASAPPPAAVQPGAPPPRESMTSRSRRIPQNRGAELAPALAGMSATGLTRVDSIILDAIDQRVTPGAALAIGRRGRLVRLRGYGRLDYRDGFAEVTDSSLYDLASLTKVVGTTTAIMLLYDDGLIDLNAPFVRYVPEFGTTSVKRSITIRQLLTHTAGLKAFAPLWQRATGRREYLTAIANTDLEYAPGTKMVYSDFGPILLGIAVERIAGKPLDEFLHDRLFHPLGLEETLFNPLAQTVALASLGVGTAPDRHPEYRDEEISGLMQRIAPTEVDTLFRRQHMHGRVHDENAFALGGVAGHAGLFSSARDLAVFAQMMLDRGRYRDRQIIRPETVDLFTRRAGGLSSRALGWDTADPLSGNYPSMGYYFSPRSYGHTGFTGTSMWIDPDQQMFVILLTNRVNPTRNNQRHIPLRTAVADAVQESIIDTPARSRREDKKARGRQD